MPFLPSYLYRIAWLAMLLSSVLFPGQARAERHGGVEIGAKGVKATVVQATNQANGLQLKIELGKTTNTTLAAGLASSGQFDPQALEETVRAVSQFFTQIRDEHKVPPERIYLVASSGLFAPLKDKPDLLQANHQRLSEAIKKATGKSLDFLDSTREAELTIAGVLPKSANDTGLVIDIGSGNTKGGYRQPKTGKFATLAIPYGTVTLTDTIRKKAEETKASFSKQASDLAADTVKPALLQQIEQHSGIRERNPVYLSGGIVWAVSTLTHPGDRGAYVPLTREDILTLIEKLQANPNTLPLPDLTSIASAADRMEAEGDIKRIKDTFTPENVLAGLHLLKALDQELASQPGKKVLFARNAYLGWLLAYIAEKEEGRK